MAIKIKFDSQNNPVNLHLILGTKSGNLIRELPINDAAFHGTLMNGSEISFRVYKERCVDENGEIDKNFWRKIANLKLAYCPESELWYELRMDINDSTETVKSITATSLGEAELGQINVYGLEINTEEDIARDNYSPTVLYDPEDGSRSLVNRLLYKAPHYYIKHVDDSIAEIQRTFKFDGKSVIDCYQDIAKEIGCLFVYECTRSDSKKIDRAISVYDLMNVCRDCGARGEFIKTCEKCGGTRIKQGYGTDTSIFVSRENLASDITFSTNLDAVKNCFRIEGGDDMMTAAVINQNPNGSQYIWYIPEEMREDMSDELKARLEAYDNLYNYYQNVFSVVLGNAILIRKNVVEQRRMGSAGLASYNQSEVDEWLNDEEGFLSRFDEDLLGALAVSAISYTDYNVNDDHSVATYQIARKVFIPSYSEMGFSTEKYEGQSFLKAFETATGETGNAARIAYTDAGTAVSTWLRSADSQTTYRCVSRSGKATSYSDQTNSGPFVRPVISIAPTVVVSAEGAERIELFPTTESDRDISQLGVGDIVYIKENNEDVPYIFLGLSERIVG